MRSRRLTSTELAPIRLTKNLLMPRCTRAPIVLLGMARKAPSRRARCATSRMIARVTMLMGERVRWVLLLLTTSCLVALGVVRSVPAGGAAVARNDDSRGPARGMCTRGRALSWWRFFLLVFAILFVCVWWGW